MSNWKRTKDELPKEGEVVIILTPYWKQYCFVRYWKEREAFFNIYDEHRYYECSRVKAWCPIPKYDLND